MQSKITIFLITIQIFLKLVIAINICIDNNNCLSFYKYYPIAFQSYCDVTQSDYATIGAYKQRMKKYMKNDFEAINCDKEGYCMLKIEKNNAYLTKSYNSYLTYKNGCYGATLFKIINNELLTKEGLCMAKGLIESSRCSKESGDNYPMLKNTDCYKIL